MFVFDVSTKDYVMIQDLNTTKDNTDDEIIAVSTQTAVVLAELAVDGMETSGVQDILPKSPTVYSTSQCDVLEASGFCVEMMALDVRLVFVDCTYYSIFSNVFNILSR